MEYRAIGTTGTQASVVGLGCEYLDNKPYETVKETIDAALDTGVNIMDIFMPGDTVRQNIGRALAGRRDKVMIQGHIGSVDLKEQYDISRDPAICQRYFEALLRHLNTDYIDFGMLFFLDSEEALKAVFEGGILEYAQKLKQAGTIRAIGASAHNPHTAAKVVESGVLDLLMFSVNPAFDMVPGEQAVLDKLDNNFSSTQLAGIDPARARLYRLCEQRGVAITTMKTLGGGKLLSAEHSPFGKALSVGQCIHYVLERPAVVSAMVGSASAAQAREAAAYLEMTDAERDYSGVISHHAGGGKAACMYCNHCLPCPANIDIAAATKYLDIAELDPENIPASIRSHYAELEHHGGDCIRCGSCEKRCPFSVQVMDNMARAKTLFGL
ncbi:aldo/keto reductase [Ruminococcaceae bacterium OttesenSCG-928-D13]|nr:aldo/keto reductase [Ruminococcaceae bacterium OttesenSCG-928-D13]